MKNALFLLMTLVTSSSGFGQVPPPPEAYAKDGTIRLMALMLRGAGLYDANDYVQAQIFYLKALEANKKNPELKGVGLAILYSNLADTYFFQSNFKESITWMQKALATKQLDTSLVAHNHYNMACAYHEMGKIDWALQKLKLALDTAKASAEMRAKYRKLTLADQQLAKLRTNPKYQSMMKDY